MPQNMALKIFQKRAFSPFFTGKSSVNSLPAQKKYGGPQTFYGFFENLSDCSHYPC